MHHNTACKTSRKRLRPRHLSLLRLLTYSDLDHLNAQGLLPLLNSPSDSRCHRPPQLLQPGPRVCKDMIASIYVQVKNAGKLTYTCTLKHMFNFRYVYIDKDGHTGTQTHICIYIYTYMALCLNVYMYTHVYKYMHIDVGFTHTCIHIYIPCLSKHTYTSGESHSGSSS